MANDAQHRDPPEFASGDEVDEVFGRANPNPDRAGCLPRDVLIGLARRERPIGDPAYDHLAKCSPCYLEVRAFQQGDAAQRRRRILAWASAAAVVVLFAGAAVWFAFVKGNGLGQSMEFRTALDLRPYALMRGETQGTREQLVIPRGRVMLTMLLPVGSEPGPYEVQILDSDLTSKASATGVADIRDHVTTLQATLDLASLPAGTYQLGVRRSGEDWQLFPAQVK
jgi:hypothetical protein